MSTATSERRGPTLVPLPPLARPRAPLPPGRTSSPCAGRALLVREGKLLLRRRLADPPSAALQEVARERLGLGGCRGLRRRLGEDELGRRDGADHELGDAVPT